MGSAAVPTPPLVSRVTWPLLARDGVVSPPLATMPPLPALRRTLPLPAARAVPSVLSRMMAPEPSGAWTATTLTPGLVAAKVMVPVWVGSPKVRVPVAVVKIRASSACLRARPVRWSAPTRMSWSGWAVRTTTPPDAGLGTDANTLTVLFPELATKRLPSGTKARAAGRFSPVRVAVRVPF
jgi:hypothetical protein